MALPTPAPETPSGKRIPAGVPWYTPRQIAAWLQFPTDWILKWIEDGTIAGEPTAYGYQITREALADWMQTWKKAA